MSSVRMCDRCGTVFSELADGWQTFQAVTVKREAGSGRSVQMHVAMDACPDCAVNTDVPLPRMPRLPAPKDGNPSKQVSMGPQDARDAKEAGRGVG